MTFHEGFMSLFTLSSETAVLPEKKKNRVPPRPDFSKQITKYHVFAFICSTVVVLCCRLKVCSVCVAKGQEMYEIQAQAKILLKVLPPVEDSTKSSSFGDCSMAPVEFRCPLPSLRILWAFLPFQKTWSGNFFLFPSGQLRAATLWIILILSAYLFFSALFVTLACWRIIFLTVCLLIAGFFEI